MCLKKDLKDKRVYQWRSTFHLGINEFRYTISYALCMRQARSCVIKFIMNPLILNLLISKIHVQYMSFSQNRNHLGRPTTVQWWRSAMQTWVNVTRVNARVTAIARKNSQLATKAKIKERDRESEKGGGRQRTKDFLRNKRSLSVIQYRAVSNVIDSYAIVED